MLSNDSLSYIPVGLFRPGALIPFMLSTSWGIISVGGEIHIFVLFFHFEIMPVEINEMTNFNKCPILLPQFRN